MPPPLDRDQVYHRFHQLVNMGPAELEEWLESEESRRVGFTRPGEHESIGHASGRRILSLLRKRRAEFDDDDFGHMRTVVGFIRRHSARRPENVVTSRWRYSLMNWGHDPLREG